jgi:ubiquinone/menaquinone biosynthesis C-methylase UbiE
MSAQIDKKETLRGVFSRGAEGYGRIGYFQHFGKHLVEAAEIKKGEKVLDVACGRGASLFPAAEAVGQEGEVIGIDLSDGMVKETKAEAEKRGITNVEVLRMDGENLKFPDNHFDVVMCGFSLQFFPNLDRGLVEFHRVLEPGGRLAVSTWAEYEDPRWTWYEGLITKYGAKLGLGTNSLDKPETIEPWIAKAGFGDIQINSERFDMVFSSEEDYWNMRYSISGRAGLEKLETAKLEELRVDTFQHMQPLREPDGFHEILEAHFTLAKKAK